MTTPGLHILVVGPDGVGKSTLADGLDVRFSRDCEVVRVHHRRPVLPRRQTNKAGPVTQPHAAIPYGPVASIAKILYLFLDIQLDWHTRTRRALRKGSWVVAERGWWDIAVDPRRYRLSCGEGLVKTLGRLVPQPDLAIILEAPGMDIYARKRELTPDEIDRQISAWGRIAFRRAYVIRVNANLPPAELVEQVAAATAVLLAGGRRWIALPSRRSSRWLIPAAPSRATLTSLSLYQPVTRRARVGWRAIQAAARTGGLRLLAGAAPPPGAIRRLQEYLPAEGHVAFSASTHPGRLTALLMDRRGDPVRIVKISQDEHGMAQLEHERQALLRWGSGLPSPIRAPAVAAWEPGLLVVEYLRPVRREKPPWSLPADVAEALGAMSHRFASERGWFSHGDVAPWNLFPSTGGWALVDWEAANDNAAPFQDVFHFLVQSATLLGRPSIADLADGVRGCGHVAPMLAAFARGAGLDMSDARAAALAYSRATIAHQDPRSNDGRRGIRGREALLAALGVAK